MFNVIRGHAAPPSLAERKSWSGDDVVKLLGEMFHDKCYICETKDPLSLNVEHFDAHQDDDDKKFDWNNLFFACARCNNFKRHIFNNLIDCTNPEIDVLRLIRHGVPAAPFSSRVTIEPMDDGPQTLETARLIDKIFNEDDTGNKGVSGAYLRKRVFKRYAKLVEYMNVYMDEDTLEAEKNLALDKIKHLMSKTQEYSAFLRWVILESPALMAEVQGSID